MDNSFQLVLMLISTPVTLLWIYFAAFQGKKYRKYIISDFAKTFQLNELFCVGFSLMAMLRVSTRSRRAQEKIKEISEIRGRKYAEFYYYVEEGAKYTYAFTILVLTLLLSVLANRVEALLLGIGFAVLIVLYLNLSLQDKLTARRQEIILDLPQVLSKLTLLVNSGMVLRDAWKKTAVTGDRTLYKEMQYTIVEIENGTMEEDAYRNFADRCNVKEVRKFANMIIQNLKKGNEELAYFLRGMSTEMWEVKKNEVKQKGEKANSQLLLPTMMIFIGIMLIVLVPVLSSVG
ncbi:MAG: type II secretion system F family protein [Blautia sp.]|nr:type II secretion system F family protein [Blautia sp.]